MMKTNDIYTAYVAWHTGGKRRPILIIRDSVSDFDFFKITSKYAQKSDRIKKNYYPINDWELAGLAKQSYVDIGNIVNLPKEGLRLTHIGRLTQNDQVGLVGFINHRYKRK